MKIITTYFLCLMCGLVFGQQARYVCHYDDVELLPLDNINTKSIEFSPVYYQQGIVYVVAREKNNVLDPKTGIAYFDLMYADFGQGGVTAKSVNFSPNIRTQFHEGPCCISSDGGELFFTRSNLSGGKGINDEKNQVQLKIYHAVKGEEDWEQIMELPFCSDQYAVAHPALSDDGRFLVFSSDMPGGYGGMDLYISDRTSGTWSEPVNLGSVLNTKEHELFPWWHPDGYLIFSSGGHDGMGGLDLFVTNFDDEGKFMGLQHLDKPFNSGRDDLGLIVSADGTSGYMASDRKPTKGKDDLYRWTSPRSIFCAPPKDPRVRRDILVMDEQDVPIANAYLWIIPMDKEGPSIYKDLFSTTLVPDEKQDGAFYLQWGVTDTLSTATADAASDKQGQASLLANKKLTYILVGQHNGYEPMVQIVPGDQLPSHIRLKKISKEEVPCLSTMFTVYDESGKLALNGAQIQITGPCLSQAMTLYTDGEGISTNCLPKGCSLKAEINQPGFAQHAFAFTPVDPDEHWKVYLKSSDKLTAPPSPIASGTVIVLDNIYYDFNKSVIRKGEADELIALAGILKQYPDLTIELTSHTDTRGSSEYNMELSQKRSDASKSYLVALGVNPSRILTKAAGESSPRNKCLDGVPCTEAEHQYNRRTEVRIINPAQGMQIKYKKEG